MRSDTSTSATDSSDPTTATGRRTPWLLGLALMAGGLWLGLEGCSTNSSDAGNGSGTTSGTQEANANEGQATAEQQSEAATQAPPAPVEPENFGFQVVAEYPHMRTSFTQGLFFYNGHLYESTGRNGTSSMRKVAMEPGLPVGDVRQLPYDEFGEGACLHQGRVYQLTWKKGKGYVYDPENLEPLFEFSYPGEGWGITSNGADLYMSDGSAYLRRFRVDGPNFELAGRLRVTDGDELVLNLNELEWVGGEIWANVWKDERIARIDPETGNVVGWIDMEGLRPDPPSPRVSPENVLNGIAYDAETGRIWVTGKLWTKLYEIRQVPR
ncbi:MAG: glutaminyl-peptide cyclotransferase [Planctomycetota bacterium]|jgi:glutaminyl-peptide cyclotransferase